MDMFFDTERKKFSNPDLPVGFVLQVSSLIFVVCRIRAKMAAAWIGLMKGMSKRSIDFEFAITSINGEMSWGSPDELKEIARYFSTFVREI